MKFMIFMMIASVQIACSFKVFFEGDSIEWVADLEIKRETDGIFCSRVEAYLQLTSDAPTIQRHSHHDDRKMFFHKTFTSNKVPGKLIGYTTNQHPFFNKAFPLRVELGRVYKVKWDVQRPFEMAKSSFISKYRISLYCVWPEYVSSDLSDNDPSWDTKSRRWLAVSNSFSIAQLMKSKKSPSLAKVFDISPASFYGDSEGLICPIAFDNIKRPVRTITNQVFEAEALIDAIRYNEKNNPNTDMVCPMTRKPLDFFWCDEALRVRALKYSSDLIKEIVEGNGWCFAQKESTSNLRTTLVNPLAAVNPMGHQFWARKELMNKLQIEVDEIQCQKKTCMGALKIVNWFTLIILVLSAYDGIFRSKIGFSVIYTIFSLLWILNFVIRVAFYVRTTHAEWTLLSFTRSIESRLRTYVDESYAPSQLLQLKSAFDFPDE